ncbi:hypothetical protein FRC07_009042, partial [Ceratobasidium sp. 392]
QRAKENIGNDAVAPPKQTRTRQSPVSQACEPKDHNETQQDCPQLTISSDIPVACYEGATRGLSPLVAQPTERVQDWTTALPVPTLEVRAHDEPATLDELCVEPGPAEECDQPETRNRRRPRSIQSVISLAESGPVYTRPGPDEPEYPSTQIDLSIDEWAPPPPRSSSSLKKALIGCPVPALSILAIGIGDEKFAGPRLVLEWLGKFLSEAVFQTITGTDAVRGTIYRTILQIFRSAEPATLIVLYFTGHSYDYNNTFILHDDQSIDENTLLSWIKRIREETSKHLPVVLVLDFCRRNPNPLVPVEQVEGVYIVWACSLGQSAYDINLGENVPCSNFLKAVCLTLDEALSNPTHPPAPLLDRVRFWLSRIVKMQRGIICHRAKCQTRWDVCACATCHGGQLCSHSNHGSDQDKPIQRPVVLFPKPEYGISTGQFVQRLQSMLGDPGWIKATQQAAKNILEYGWYKEFIPPDLTIGLSDPTGGTLQATDPVAPHKRNSLLSTSSGPLVASTSFGSAGSKACI